MNNSIEEYENKYRDSKMQQENKKFEKLVPNKFNRVFALANKIKTDIENERKENRKKFEGKYNNINFLKFMSS